MLEDNIEIISEKGEYKEFPYKKSVYLYGKCVWTDDFSGDLNAKEVIEAFCNQLRESVCDYDQIYK